MKNYHAICLLAFLFILAQIVWHLTAKGVI
jgi:hypothetical protein